MQNLGSILQIIDTCNVCGSGNLEEILSLPKFPFTGIFCSDEIKIPDFVCKGVDQALLFCPECGHAQLKAVIHPNLVYDHTYFHRGSISPIASNGNVFFADFVNRLFPNKVFEKILDIGCNDGFLLKNLEKNAKSLLGIDPIWAEKEYSLTSKIDIKGGFVEDSELKEMQDVEESLVVSAHTFEHIKNPKEVLQKVLSKTPENTTLVIEVPCFDTLVENHRFDQVFHQHIQYFSCSSFCRLLKELECEYLAHSFNYSMWGGTLLFAFKKAKGKAKEKILPKISKKQVKESIQNFQSSLFDLSSRLSYLKGENIYGFGAAQMLPSLAYHVPGRLTNISLILDDNPYRQGLRYPEFPFSITSPNKVDLTNATVVITALDSARPILKRLIDLRVKRILIPTQVI